MYFGGIWSFSLLLRAGPLTSRESINLCARQFSIHRAGRVSNPSSQHEMSQKQVQAISRSSWINKQHPLPRSNFLINLGPGSLSADQLLTKGLGLLLVLVPDSTVVGTNISKPTRNLAQTIPPDWLNHLNRTAKTRTMPRNVTLTVRSMGYLADLQYIRLVSNTEYTVSADESIVAQGRDALLFEDANK